MKTSAQRGFTLIELLVVISIISILSMVGFVSYQNVRNSALAAKRRADIDAIKKAYETNFDPTLNGGQGGYKPLTGANFASGGIPTPPGGGSYIVIGPDTGAAANNTSTDGTNGPNYAACVNLADGTRCGAPTPLTNNTGCYCASSVGGTILTTNTSSSCDAYNLLTTGLVSRWKLDGDVTDVVGSSPGTWTGTVAYTAGVNTTFGQAASFTTNSISIGNPASLQLTSAITLAAWVKPTDITSSNADTGIINKANLEYGITRDERSTSTNTRIWGYINGGSNGVYANLSNLTQWHHVVLTYDKAATTLQQKLYIDGVLVQSRINAAAAIPTTANSSLSIGSGLEGQQYHGLIDDVRVYNRALSVGEVGLLYNSGNGCL